MERKRVFEPGDYVKSSSNHFGIVLSRHELEEARTRFQEGRKPGRFFAPGCCQDPDNVLQIPVLFEDGTFDIMRSMNLRKMDPPGDKKVKIQKMMER